MSVNEPREKTSLDRPILSDMERLNERRVKGRKKRQSERLQWLKKSHNVIARMYRVFRRWMTQSHDFHRSGAENPSSVNGKVQR